MNQDFVRFAPRARPLRPVSRPLGRRRCLRSVTAHFARIGSASSLLRLAALFCASTLLFSACSGPKADAPEGAPPAANVQADFNPENFTVDHPDLFPLARVAQRKTFPATTATGVVQPDIARAVPVISLAAGRVVEIRARLGDVVKKGQVLVRVQSNDVSGAFQTYMKAENDQRLAHLELDRAQTLYDHGAISKAALEQAEDTEADAKADLNASSEQLRLLGIDKRHPSGIADVLAPISGVITDQQVTNASGVQGLSGPNPFTISDLSYVWIVCDVYENDLDAVRVGQYADIRLNAYPNRMVKGRIDNILPVLDPTIRTAKVRIEVPNSGIMRVGMFVTATFYGRQPVVRAVVPATAVLHLHDRDWVYAFLGNGRFKRQEITSGAALPGNMQEVVSGLKPGERVVENALELENTVEQ